MCDVREAHIVLGFHVCSFLHEVLHYVEITIVAGLHKTSPTVLHRSTRQSEAEGQMNKYQTIKTHSREMKTKKKKKKSVNVSVLRISMWLCVCMCLQVDLCLCMSMRVCLCGFDSACVCVCQCLPVCA